MREDTTLLSNVPYSLFWHSWRDPVDGVPGVVLGPVCVGTNERCAKIHYDGPKYRKLSLAEIWNHISRERVRISAIRFQIHVQPIYFYHYFHEWSQFGTIFSTLLFVVSCHRDLQKRVSRHLNRGYSMVMPRSSIVAQLKNTPCLYVSLLLWLCDWILFSIW